MAEALGGKADRSDVLTTLGALQTMLLSKMDRTEAEQLLARKLDIRTFLASQVEAPPKPLVNSGAAPPKNDMGTPRIAPVSGPYPGVGIETASAADLLRTAALRTAGTMHNTSQPERSSEQVEAQDWGLPTRSRTGSEARVSGFGVGLAQAGAAGRLSSVWICPKLARITQLL
jgi:hypothetical protein